MSGRSLPVKTMILSKCWSLMLVTSFQNEIDRSHIANEL